MATFLQVTAPVAIIRDAVGAQHYFYDGAVLPSGLEGDHVKQLLDQGMVAEVTVEVDDGGGPETPSPNAEEESGEGDDGTSSESKPAQPAKKTAAPRRS